MFRESNPKYRHRRKTLSSFCMLFCVQNTCVALSMGLCRSCYWWPSSGDHVWSILVYSSRASLGIKHMLNDVEFCWIRPFEKVIWLYLTLTITSYHIPLKLMVIDDVYLVGAYLIHTSRHASIRFHTLPSSDIVRYGSDLPSCGHHFPLRCPILDFALAGHMNLENFQEITKLKGNCKKHGGVHEWGYPHSWLVDSGKYR